MIPSAAHEHPRQRRQSAAWLSMRVIWSLLALSHAWPLIVVVGRLLSDPSAGDVLSLAVLLAVLPLFALKAVDVAKLRPRRPMIEFIAWTVAAAVAHHDVATHDAVRMVYGEATVAAMVSIGVAALASRRARRRISELLRAVRLRARAPRLVYELVGTLCNADWSCVGLGRWRPRAARAPPLG